MIGRKDIAEALGLDEDADDIWVYHCLLVADLGEEINYLDDRDTSGHLWLNRFRTFLTDHYKKYNESGLLIDKSKTQ